MPDGLFVARNQWYVAAFRTELTTTPLERWILDQPVVFYRCSNGTPVALEGRCPHRGLPLSMGKLVGDDLQCRYHGVRFGPDGRCAHVPTQTMAPAACDLKAYPLLERGPWVWIWPGESSAAAEDMLPPLYEIGLEDPAFELCVEAYRQVSGRYMLLHDNLLDLSHLEYLHASGIGAEGAARVDERRTHGENWVCSERHQTETPCPPFFHAILNYSGAVDRRFGMTCHVPCLHAGFDDFTRARSDPDRPGESLGRIRVYHAITPGRRVETHYFFAAARDFARSNAALTQAMYAATEQTLSEDIAATEGIERLLRDLPSPPREVLLRADATCVQGRRLFEALMRGEAAGGD
jgi:phenylpropionate dioxygenase-like ring-hydroxylating dioxygenase large terminal subunit